MGADLDWSTLLADYEAAIDDFAQASRALTAALVGGRPAEDVQVVLAAESRTRDVAALMRMRLVNQWRDSHADVATPLVPTEDDDQHV
jgi:hypothetical protein